MKHSFMQKFYLWTHISRIIAEYLTSDMHANSCLCTLGRSIKLHISRNSNINVIPVSIPWNFSNRIAQTKTKKKKKEIYNRLILLHYYCSGKVTRIFFSRYYIVITLISCFLKNELILYSTFKFFCGRWYGIYNSLFFLSRYKTWISVQVV